jgi:predicted MFS family arabinose efflux permease
MYGGLGQSVGAIIGGAMSRSLGIVNTFVIAACSDFIAILLFIAFQLHKGYTSRQRSSKDQTN